jgi:cysteine synthase B
MEHACLLNLIGNTPLVPLERFRPPSAVHISAKLEMMNPTGSLKDRIAKYMIEEAERAGMLTHDRVIIEASSGNTGIALAMVGGLKGYKVRIFMPESKSVERRVMMYMWGADLVLTSRHNPYSHIEAAKELAASGPGYFYIDQNENENNMCAHYHTTAAEILQQAGAIDVFVAGLGTGGTLMGVGRRLKEVHPHTRIVAVEPATPISQIEGLLHLDGSYMPGIYDPSHIDQTIYVPDSCAIETARAIALREGLFVGISSGATLWAALQLARQMESGHIVVIFGDRGERYLSTGLCAHARE